MLWPTQMPGSRSRAFATAFAWALRPLLLASIGCGGSAEESGFPARQRPVRLYVAAGQSNMVGFGAFAASRHRTPHPGVTFQYLDTQGRLQPPRATPSFFRHGSIRLGYASFRDRGVGPWWSFARRMADEGTEADIRVLMLAVNGSSLADWMGGGLTHRAIEAIRDATSAGGTLEGVIWYQGESGTGSSDIEYGEMLESLVGKIRSDLHMARLPFVASTLPATSPHSSEVNAALGRLAAGIPAFEVVDVPETTLSDAVHLDTAATEKLGVAMADAMIRLHRSEGVGGVP